MKKKMHTKKRTVRRKGTMRRTRRKALGLGRALVGTGSYLTASHLQSSLGDLKNTIGGVRGGAGAVSQAPTPFDLNASALDAAVTQLTDALRDLGLRLEPVLGPSQPSGKPEPEPPESSVRVIGLLQNIERRARTLQATVADLTERLVI